jgi:hypothetical protein
MHLDILVDDLDAAEAQVLGLGGTLLDGSDKPIGFRVYAPIQSDIPSAW